MELSEIVDLNRYPLDRLSEPEGEALVAACRSQLAETGSCLLPGFLRPGAIAAALRPRGRRGRPRPSGGPPLRLRRRLRLFRCAAAGEPAGGPSASVALLDPHPLHRQGPDPRRRPGQGAVPLAGHGGLRGRRPGHAGDLSFRLPALGLHLHRGRSGRAPGLAFRQQQLHRHPHARGLPCGGRLSNTCRAYVRQAGTTTLRASAGSLPASARRSSASRPSPAPSPSSRGATTFTGPPRWKARAAASWRS